MFCSGTDYFPIDSYILYSLKCRQPAIPYSSCLVPHITWTVQRSPNHTAVVWSHTLPGLCNVHPIIQQLFGPTHYPDCATFTQSYRHLFGPTHYLDCATFTQSYSSCLVPCTHYPDCATFTQSYRHLFGPTHYPDCATFTQSYSSCLVPHITRTVQRSPNHTAVVWSHTLPGLCNIHPIIQQLFGPTHYPDCATFTQSYRHLFGPTHYPDCATFTQSYSSCLVPHITRTVQHSPNHTAVVWSHTLPGLCNVHPIIQTLAYLSQDSPNRTDTCIPLTGFTQSYRHLHTSHKIVHQDSMTEHYRISGFNCIVK